jgi:hypothetical protein
LRVSEIRLLIEDCSWHTVAPTCFMTPPPAMPHGFSISDDGDGHVQL